MSGESTGFDPYEAVLADLKAQRDKIDQAISAIESVRTGGGGQASGPVPQNIGVDTPGAFLAMTIPEAAIKLLKARRQPLRNPEIAAAFKIGGLALNSVDPVNTIGAVLSRRANEQKDIVKVGRGTWGLKEWYPGRSFKKEAKAEAEEKEEPKEKPPEAKPQQSAGGPSQPQWPSNLNVVRKLPPIPGKPPGFSKTK